MTIQFILDQHDFLTFQLFTTSTLESAKKRRKRIRIMVPLIYLALGFWLYFKDQEHNYKLTISLVILAILWYFIFPYFEARSYKKRLLNYIMTQYKDTLPMSVDMNWEAESLITKDEEQGSRIFYKNFQEIMETGNYIFVKIENTGQSLILPKQKIQSASLLQERLKSIATEYAIPYHFYPNWKWQ